MHIRRHAHCHGSVVAQIDQAERHRHLDLRVPPGLQLAFLEHELADETVPLIAKHCFQKTDSQRLPEVENAEAICLDSPARIAEPTPGLSKAEGVRILVQIDAAKALASGYFVDPQPSGSKVRWWADARHSGEVPARDTLGCGNGIRAPAALERLPTRQATERLMRLHEETINGPRRAQTLQERAKLELGLAIRVELPDREAEAPPRAVEPEKLATLPFGVHGDTRNA